jgi:hypothetical protein
VILTGCAGGTGDSGGAEPTTASSSPTPSPTASASPAAEPAAPGPAEKIIIATAGVTIQRADGQTEEFTYFDPTQSLVDGLTEAFGEEPVVSHNTPEEPGPSTSTEWSGFTLTDPESPVAAPYSVEYAVFTSVAEVGGVVIETAEGAQVGDSALEAVDRYPIGPSDFTNDQGGQGATFSTDFIELPEGGTDGTSGKMFSTALTATDLNAGLTSIYAPSPNWLQ